MSTMTLAAGLTALGIALPEAAQLKLLAFRDLLLKWNRTYNLTALRDPQQAISHHLLDALAILPHVGDAMPELAVTMVDTVQKKTTFLQQAVIELGLKNVTVHHARVEELQGQYAQISSRAFAEIGLFISLTRHLLAPGGRWLAMKGVRPDDELKALPADITVEAIIPLTVPGLDAERHLIILKAGS